MFFFFNDTATTEIYTLSLHDALPIYIDTSGTFGTRNHNVLTATNISGGRQGWDITNINVDSAINNSQTEAVFKFQTSNDNYYPNAFAFITGIKSPSIVISDRKSTRLNSSHANISYAVFCLKKKK